MKKSDFKKLRKSLPAKWAETLHQKTGFSVSFIRQVLYGLKPNDIIVKEAIKLAKEYKKENANMANEIKSL